MVDDIVVTIVNGKRSTIQSKDKLRVSNGLIFNERIRIARALQRG